MSGRTVHLLEGREMVRPFAVPDLVCLTGSEAGDFDARSIRDRGVPESALMERAGAGAAAVIRHSASARDALILAGKGNNGGDALVVARCLAAWGWRVELLTTSARPPDDPLLHGWTVPARASEELDDSELTDLIQNALDRGAQVVDGVLGTGIKGSPRGEAGRVVAALEGAGPGRGGPGRLVSLDIPSGVDADTGAVPGPAVYGDLTVSFGWPKLGSLLHPGRARAGRQVTLEIGFPPLDPDLAGRRLLTPAWASRHRPQRSAVTHKNQVGALAVVGGKPGMAGAAILAGRSALRSGAGYVRVVTHPDNREVVQSALPEAVYVDATDAGAVTEALARSRAVAVGPGLGIEGASAELLARVLATPIPRVVDADALTLLAGEPGLRAALSGAPVVVTPHPGEADRILGESGPGPAGRLDSIRALRDELDSVVLLKGAPSLVLGPEGLWVEVVGSSDLAVAGMGDTLTGAIGAFLAQGSDPQTAAGLGLVTTARAAARAGAGAGLQAADVPEWIPAALVEGPGGTDLDVPGILLDLDPAR
ncbi:MAG: NAD(P)H-hydrate dehydratase [Gemmatimonadales bacterium]|jgi:NAD(P)H-hydrate epimerase|nr:MAG: NAD(P)H-hydrate dehydratase [Gemmatimonadales bacterium]